jgi:hypothetical protein
LNLKKQKCREENGDCKKGHEIGIQGLSGAHGRYSTGNCRPSTREATSVFQATRIPAIGWNTTPPAISVLRWDSKASIHLGIRVLPPLDARSGEI